MPRRVGFSGQHLTLEEITNHHSDLIASLELYFTDSNPTFVSRFLGMTKAEIDLELLQRLAEVDTNSAMSALAAIEAAFRIDYLQRCYQRKGDRLSRELRGIHRRKGARASLKDEILEVWKLNSTAPAWLIGHLRGAFKFRHWVAHGRYWVPRLGQQYDFDTVHMLADEVFEVFPFEGI